MSAHANGSLKRNLGLWAIVGLGLGYMTPTVVFDTFGIVSDDTNGAVPTAYLVALVVMAFTAISYGKMVGAFPTAGSAYTYTRESMHPNLGFMVGWTALLDYILLPLVNILILRLYMEQMLPDVPSWIWVILFTAIITAFVYVSMKGTSNLNALLLIFSLVVMVIIVAMIIFQLNAGKGNGEVFGTTPFVGQDFDPQLIMHGATVVCFSFIGFDAVTMYAEEAKDSKIMPKAIITTVVLGGVIFFVASYFAQQRFPDNSEFGDFENPLPQIGLIVGGYAFMVILTTAGFAATVASTLASHASVSRMLLVMGRNGVLPSKFFGHISTKTSTPTFNIVLVGIIALSAFWWDLDTIASVINFGALIAFTFVNLSVIAWFAVRKGMRRNFKEIFKYIIMPGIATLMTLSLWVNLDHIALTAGGIWLLVGFFYLIYITKGFKEQPKSFDEAQPVTGFNKIPEDA